MFCEQCGCEVEEDDAFCRKCGSAVRGSGAGRRTRACTRDREGRMLAGVCSGYAAYFGKDVTLIRISWTVLALIPPLFPGVGAYVISWLLMPQARADEPQAAQAAAPD